MKRQLSRGITAGMGLATAALAATAFVAWVPASASTATSKAAVVANVLPLRALAPNNCGLPTEAHPNSIWLPPNYENCRDCLNRAYILRTQYGLNVYCTYNPSNGKTDLHRDL